MSDSPSLSNVKTKDDEARITQHDHVDEKLPMGVPSLEPFSSLALTSEIPLSLDAVPHFSHIIPCQANHAPASFENIFSFHLQDEKYESFPTSEVAVDGAHREIVQEMACVSLHGRSKSISSHMIQSGEFIPTTTLPTMQMSLSGSLFESSLILGSNDALLPPRVTMEDIDDIEPQRSLYIDGSSGILLSMNSLSHSGSWLLG